MRFKSERFCYWQDTFGENESDTVFSLTPYSPRTVWSLSALTIITKPYNFWPSWSSYVCECYLRPCPLSAWRKFATPLLDMQCWWQCYCFCLLVAELWGEATASLLSFGKVLYMHSRSPSSRWCILSSLFCGNIVHFGLVAWVWKGGPWRGCSQKWDRSQIKGRKTFETASNIFTLYIFCIIHIF